MNNDLTVFWHNNERSCALFCDLLDRAEQGAFDDDFLAQLAAYREETTDTAHADLFAAQYLLHHGDAETAMYVRNTPHITPPLYVGVHSEKGFQGDKTTRSPLPYARNM